MWFSIKPIITALINSNDYYFSFLVDNQLEYKLLYIKGLGFTHSFVSVSFALEVLSNMF